MGIPVKAHYGMVEKVSMFFQCDHSDAYHESMEYGVTEFIDDGGNRQVVGTGFLNYTMPFIRYQMNDYATLNPDGLECACGRGLPLTVLDFEGRRDNVLVTPDGRLVPGGNFYVMMYEIPGIEMFQIIQHEPGRVEIKLVTSKSFTDENLQRVKEGMFKRMGNLEFQIAIVDEIERDRKTGKIRCIINKVREV